MGLNSEANKSIFVLGLSVTRLTWKYVLEGTFVQNVANFWQNQPKIDEIRAIFDVWRLPKLCLLGLNFVFWTEFGPKNGFSS